MSANFPAWRGRRLRASAALRAMASETTLSTSQLIAPVFIKEAIGAPVAISAMPGHFQHTVESVLKETSRLAADGVPAVLLFGIPQQRDATGSRAWANDGGLQRAARAIKKEFGDDLVCITDLCLCEYTEHGHCGVFRDGDVDNDETLKLYEQIALSHAEAGADLVAPSGMIDGQVAAIRGALDSGGHQSVGILAYSAKFASCFYGPFREAAESAPLTGDRKTYQMNPANLTEALREAASDVAEGADILMVKPALAYLDVIRAVKDHTGYPVAAYNVSGEYSMVKAAASRGWIDGEQAMLEILIAIKRAGADLIVTYFADEAARILKR